MRVDQKTETKTMQGACQLSFQTALCANWAALSCVVAAEAGHVIFLKPQRLSSRISEFYRFAIQPLRSFMPTMEPGGATLAADLVTKRMVTSLPRPSPLQLERPQKLWNSWIGCNSYKTFAHCYSVIMPTSSFMCQKKPIGGRDLEKPRCFKLTKSEEDIDILKQQYQNLCFSELVRLFLTKNMRIAMLFSEPFHVLWWKSTE